MEVRSEPESRWRPSIPCALDGLLALRPFAFAQAGLIVLIAAPVLRVATSVVGFWLEGDRLYVAITLAVLAILLGSIFLVH